MAGEFTLRVITPDRIALDTSVESARLPGADGSIGILPRHAPMAAVIAAGELSYVEHGTRKRLFVSDGFAEVGNNIARVVCEAGELPEQIDVERAREAERRARERLSLRGQAMTGEESIDFLRAEAALRRAMMRLNVHTGVRERS
jgi:F-type H+-transporting ATPase subunit epsilon